VSPFSWYHLRLMNADKRHQIYTRLSEAIPAPETELEYRSNYQLLVAVVLSAQATDISVNLATRTLFIAAPGPQAMVELGVDGVKQHIRRIGLFNTKAVNVVRLSELLLERHAGEVPDERKALEALPGVGRKTANVLLNTAFGQPTIAVDTHLFRLGNRIGLARGKTPREVEDKLVRSTPREFLRDAHHLLILHGRYVCTARTPKCAACVLADLCEFKEKTAAGGE